MMIKLLFAALSLAYIMWGAVALWITHETFPDQAAAGAMLVRSDYQECRMIRGVPLELRKLRQLGERTEDNT